MLKESWKSERASEPSEAYIKLMKIEGIIMIVLSVLIFALLFRRTPITSLIGVKRTSKASQSGFISPKATWNMKPLVTIRMSVG